MKQRLTKIRRGTCFRGQAGLTLLEMVVVTSILAVLSAIISLSVTGRSTESRATVQLSDRSAILSALLSYSGQHPDGRYPTLNGCQPDRNLDLITMKCVQEGNESNPSQVNTNNLQFNVSELDIGVDLNGDGDLADAHDVVPLIWHKAFRTGSNQKATFLGDFLQGGTKHAFEFVEGGDLSWEDGENFDPENMGNSTTGPSKITAPEGLGTGDNKIDPAIGQVPVWVIGLFRANQGIEVQVLLPPERY